MEIIRLSLVGLDDDWQIFVYLIKLFDMVAEDVDHNLFEALHFLSAPLVRKT